MPTRPILRFPNPQLRQPAAPVTIFDAALKTLADDLLDTMRAAPGIGITGPHIGIFQRIIVLELTPEGAPATLEADGLLSVCLQHEIDQLDGIFWTQRLSRLKRDRLIKKWEKQNKP